MAKEIDTKAETAVEESKWNLRDARLAYELRRKGKSIGFIADYLNMDDPRNVMDAINDYQSFLATAREAEVEATVQMELARLDYLQEALSEHVESPPMRYNKEGDELGIDVKVLNDTVKTTLSIMKQRAELLQLNKLDPETNRTQVLIVSGEQADYVNMLKGVVAQDKSLAPAPERPTGD